MDNARECGGRECGGRVPVVEDHYPEEGTGQAVSSVISKVPGNIIRRITAEIGTVLEPIQLKKPSSNSPTMFHKRYLHAAFTNKKHEWK